ncbi:MAG: hypothetical protein JOZ39_00180 [Chloroflexi bacterium]|nr:hypothetical protein [Chloroflexota bacterium]
MFHKPLLGLAATIPWLFAALPVSAQTATAVQATASQAASTSQTSAAMPAQPCQFQFGFATIDQLVPTVVGNCVTPQMTADNGDAMQQTSTGLLSYSKSTGVVEFTNGEHTWVYGGPYGLIMRDGTVSYPWEGTVSLVAGISIDNQGHAINPATGQVIPTDSRIKIS